MEINQINLNFNQDFEKIKKASELLQKGKFRESKEIYLEIIKIYSKNSNINSDKINSNLILQLCNHHLGNLELYNKNYNISEFYFNEAILYAIGEKEKLFLTKLLGESLLGLNKFKKAIEIFENILKNINYNKIEIISIKILYARALFNLDQKSNSTKAISILEDEILLEDPENVEALVYLSDFGIKQKLGKFCINHLIMAIAISSINKNIKKNLINLAKINFCDLIIGDKDNLIIFEMLKNDMPVYRLMAEVLKEFGAIEIALEVFKNALNFDNVKIDIREELYCVINVVKILEIMNRYQESYQIIKNFIKNNLKNLNNIKNLSTLNIMKYLDVYNILENVDDIFLDEYRIINNEMTNYNNNLNLDENNTNNIIPYNDFELELLGLYFTLVKILFISGCLSIIPKLINLIKPNIINREFHNTIICNQNSYFNYIKKLIEKINKNNINKNKIYVCGDSHSLSLAWRNLNNKILIPKLVTGMKCWHMQNNTEFYTKKNLDIIINSIPDNSTVIFIFGEIDCREGIIGAYDKCRYNSIQEAIKFTADIYLNYIKNCQNVKKLKAYIHPVPPVLDATRKIVKMFNEYLRNQSIIEYLDFAENLLSDDKESFRTDFELDGTHMSPGYLKLLESFSLL